MCLVPCVLQGPRKLDARPVERADAADDMGWTKHTHHPASRNAPLEPLATASASLSCNDRIDSGSAGLPGHYASPNPERMLALHLSVSDVNKALLLASPGRVVPYLLDGLLLESNHPRANLPEEKRAWLQRMHCECLAQLALFPAGRDALTEDASVATALEAVMERGLLKEARMVARQALQALRLASRTADDDESPAVARADGGRNSDSAKHVMISVSIPIASSRVSVPD